MQGIGVSEIRVLSRCLRLILAAALGLTLSCGVATARRSMFGGSLPFNVTVDAEANENSAIAFDVVMLYDAKLADELIKLRAGDWFTQKKQLIRDHPKRMRVRGWEWAPGQKVGDIKVEYSAGAKKVVLFADYATDGEHREIIEPPRRFDVVLGKTDFTVEVKQ